MSRIKFCQSCGSKAIEISEEEYQERARAFHSFISTKYCCECSDYFNRLKLNNRKREYRQRIKEVKKIKDKRICLLDELARLLREENEELRQEIDRMKETYGD